MPRRARPLALRAVAGVRYAAAIAAVSCGVPCGCQLAYSPQYPPAAPATAPAVAVEGRTRVLFVGNSLTYYNDLPGYLALLSRREARPVEFEVELVGGRSLQGHWNSGAALRKLRGGSFDLVVLQDYSVRPAVAADAAVDTFVRFDREARAAGARSIVFENWTRAGRSADAPLLAETYRRVREQTGAAGAPVGEAWRRTRQRHPEIRLLVDDRHPTPAGTYLAACVLYQVIYGKPVPPDAPLPHRLSPEIAAQLRPIAAETVTERSR